jgi:hypothetical protein
MEAAEVDPEVVSIAPARRLCPTPLAGGQPRLVGPAGVR